MMKLAAICMMLICSLHHCVCSANPTYTSKYDDVNLDEVIASERLLTGYVNCLMDLGPCTPDGKELKNNLPDAIANECKSCTERQRDGADKVMHHLIDNRPGDWEKLEQKYESDGSYKQRYLEDKLSKNKSKEEGSLKETYNGTYDNSLEDNQ